MTSKVIAICGHEGSGKSTAAKFIASSLARKGYTTKVISFSAPLKELCNSHLKIDKTNRRALEEFAMDARRILGNNVFTNVTFTEMRLGIYDYYIIDDLRYPHELSRLHDSEHLTYILKTRSIESREADDTRLDELLTFVEVNNIDIIQLPDDYEELYRFVEKFIELVR